MRETGAELFKGLTQGQSPRTESTVVARERARKLEKCDAEEPEGGAIERPNCREPRHPCAFLLRMPKSQGPDCS